jgi:hypothetical protein
MTATASQPGALFVATARCSTRHRTARSGAVLRTRAAGSYERRRGATLYRCARGVEVAGVVPDGLGDF